MKNIDIEVLALLKTYKFDLFDIKEQQLWGMSDKEIIEKAFAEQRVISPKIVILAQ